MVHLLGRFALQSALGCTLLAVVVISCSLGRLAAQSAAVDAEILSLARAVDRLVVARVFGIQPASPGRAARAGLAANASSSDLSLLTNALRSPEPRVRAAALRGLGRLETPADVATEVAFLVDPDARVRREAASAIVESLRNPEAPEFREATILAFRSLTARALTEPGGATAGMIFEALGQLRDPDLSREIEQTLVRGTRLSSAPPGDLALRQLGALRGLEALIRRRGRQTPIASDTRQRLRQLALPGFGFPDDIGPVIPAVQALVAAGEDDGNTVLRVAGFQCSESPRTRGLPTFFRADCGWEIRRLGFQMMKAPLPQFLPALKRGLSDPSFRVRIEALRAHDRETSDAPSCATNLAAMSDQSLPVATEAAGLLKSGCLEASEVITELHAHAADLGNSLKASAWHLPLAALETLSRFSPAAAAEVAGDAGVRHPVWQVRAGVVRVAATLGDADLILRFVKDSEPNVRAEVLVALQHVGSDQVVAAAIDALARTRDYRPTHQVIYAAAMVLRKSVQAPGVVPAVARALADLNGPGDSARVNESSREARLALLDLVRESRSSDRAFVDLVRGMIRDSDPRVAIDAAETLTTLTGDVVVPAPMIRAPELRTSFPDCVEITLPRGYVTVRLRSDEAPVAVSAFLSLVDRNYYSGLTFHRAYATGYLHGGSPDASDYSGSDTLIRDESGAAHHQRGTVGIAQRGRHAGNLQMFVNLVDAPHLDREFTVLGNVQPCRPGDRRTDLMMDLFDEMREGDRIVAIKRIGG